MTTKQLIPNNGKLLNILKGNANKQKATGTVSVLKICIEKEEAHLESKNSEIKTVSDHKKQVSLKAKIETSFN